SYDIDSVLSDPDNSVRKRRLATASEQESRLILWRAFHRDRDLTPVERFERVLSSRPTSKRAAALFYAWNRDTSVDALARWLAPRFAGLDTDIVRSLAHAYGNPRFTLLDYAYL